METLDDQKTHGSGPHAIEGREYAKVFKLPSSAPLQQSHGLGIYLAYPHTEEEYSSVQVLELD